MDSALKLQELFKKGDKKGVDILTLFRARDYADADDILESDTVPRV